MLIRNRASDDVADLFDRLQEDVAGVIAGLMAEDMPTSALPEGVDSGMAVEATAMQLLGGLTAIANWWDEHRDVARSTVLAMVMEFAWVGLQRASSGERWDPCQSATLRTLRLRVADGPSGPLRPLRPGSCRGRSAGRSRWPGPGR